MSLRINQINLQTRLSTVSLFFIMQSCNFCTLRFCDSLSHTSSLPMSSQVSVSDTPSDHYYFILYHDAQICPHSDAGPGPPGQSASLQAHSSHRRVAKEYPALCIRDLPRSTLPGTRISIDHGLRLDYTATRSPMAADIGRTEWILYGRSGGRCPQRTLSDDG